VPRDPSKRAINLAVRIDLAGTARAAGVNFSALLERALIEELRELRCRAWRLENARAIEAYNAHVGDHGVLSDPRRCF
jgi:antitoxin CcdA